MFLTTPLSALLSIRMVNKWDNKKENKKSRGSWRCGTGTKESD
jgi:hypothetical protein